MLTPHRLDGTLPVRPLFGTRRLFNTLNDPNAFGILPVSLLLSRYRYCRLVNNDNDDGIDPVRLFVDSRSVANLDDPLNVLGIDPRRLFVLTSSNVNDVNRPMAVGRLPVSPAPDRLTDTTTPPLHVTLFHDDVDGPVHTVTVTGYAPLHCQLLYAPRLLAPVAAARSHIILS